MYEQSASWMPQDPLLTQYGRWTIQQRGISASQAPGCTSCCQNTTGTVGLRKQPTFHDANWSPRERSPEIPYWWRVTTQIRVVLLIGWCKFPSWQDQSEAPPSYGYWRVISMEFLRRHFAEKPLVTSRNVGCFLGLQPPVVQKADSAILQINLHPLNSVIGFPTILRSLSQVCTWNYLRLDWINLHLNDTNRNDSGSKRPIRPRSSIGIITRKHFDHFSGIKLTCTPLKASDRFATKLFATFYSIILQLIRFQFEREC